MKSYIFEFANTTFKKPLLIFLCYDNQINTLSKDKIMHFFRSLYTFYWIFITMIPILMHLKKIQTYHWCEFCCVVFRLQKIAREKLVEYLCVIWNLLFLLMLLILWICQFYKNNYWIKTCHFWIESDYNSCSPIETTLW